MANSDSRFRQLLDYLTAEKANQDPWIFRKEIAAWAAVVLYLPMLFTFYNFVKAESNNCVLLIIEGFIVIICGLFLLLLYKHYDSIFNLQAKRRVLDYWIFRMIDEGKIPDDFSLTIREESVTPIGIIDRIDVEKKYFRRSSHLKIFCVPWKVAISLLLNPSKKDNNSHQYHNQEIQESIVYYIVILFTLLLLFYIAFKIDWNSFLLPIEDWD